MSPVAKAHAQMHFCVVLWGFTAVLGRLISLSAVNLVFWRMLVVVVALLLVPRVWRALRATPAGLILTFAGIGLVVAAHWVTFYAAIKLANASVAATTIALAPVFLAIVEPLLSRRRFNARELLLGLAVVPGVALVVGGVSAEMRPGIAVGALSAFLAAVFSVLNKRYIEHADALLVTGLELGAGTLALALLAPWWNGALPTLPGPRDALLLLVLSLGCTLLPFALWLVALRQLSAFTTNLITNLEPVYAIALAALLLDEQRDLGGSFYAGCAIVLAAVALQPLVERRRQSAPAAATMAVSDATTIRD